jgi:hypothetical protein
MVQNCTLFSFSGDANHQKMPGKDPNMRSLPILATVYSKGTDVHCEAQMRRWYGDLLNKKWLHGTIRNFIKNPVNGRNQHFYEVEYINPDKTTKLHELRDIGCRDTPDNVEHVSPDHPIFGLTDVTTPNDANHNTVTITPELYEQMADMSTIEMPETQRKTVATTMRISLLVMMLQLCLLQCLLTQYLGLQMWTSQ